MTKPRFITEKYSSKFKSSQIFYNVLAKWTFCVEQLFFFRPKTISKVATTKTKSTILVLFFFLLLVLSFSPFLFLRYYDFGASRA